MHYTNPNRDSCLLVLIFVLLATAIGTPHAQTRARDTLPDGPQIFDSSRRGPSGRAIPGPQFRVVPLKGLSHPYALAFLPNGDILITERAGRLRIVRNGVLDPTPIAGMPLIANRTLQGLNDIALHPHFADNKWVYFTYYRESPGDKEAAAAVLARGRFDGTALTEVRDVFVTDTMIAGASAARFVFGRDGKIYLAIGVPLQNSGRAGLATMADAQNPASHFGKVLRLNDDGSVPPDNPFRNRPGYKPDIYALGIRNAMAMIVHPETGEIWENENGPQGGDEINIIRAGRNYGWPTVSFGRSYAGDRTGGSGPALDQYTAPGVDEPWRLWVPSISLSGMAFYTGDQFPEWKGSLFVGALIGEALHRVVLNREGLPIRRDPLLVGLKQRIREVRQGPDGFVYLLTDEDAGALLRLEPIPDA
jgi:glucose/arabinose dehydrogenase